MEVGDQTFQTVKDKLKPGDLNVHLKAGIVVQGNMGSLIALGDAIAKYMEEINGKLVFFTFTGEPLYLVHYNDLSEQKKANIERKKVR